jgi:pyruvate/2-oxoglutarate/acetoin dehydrogenase E1 component
LAAFIGEHAFEDLDAPVKRLGALDVPTPFAEELETAAIPSSDDIAETLTDLLAF